ncbi:hypothetical protein MKEN_00091600 [Mycena kentingensis (nom. inval.)]|nr:hypothetical protein MKEN_00091600 [Mycena kentingensis (nom. inval.)]
MPRSPHAPSSYCPPPSPHSRRPSISNPMGWLSRSSTQSSISSVKTSRISEPKLLLSSDLMSPRAGILGEGAIVVRTPEEALRETKVPAAFDEDAQDIEYTPPSGGESSSEEEDELPSPLDSPPLPAIPGNNKEAHHEDEDALEPTTPQPFTFPPRSARLAPLRTSLKPNKPESVESVPALPAAFVPAVAPFHAILLSDPPLPTADRSQVVVSLETSTATLRTTLSTLCARPSHLARYIAANFGRRRSDSDASSVYSTASANDDMSVYRRHLTSQGLLSQTRPSPTVHLFLDRPSEPYVHILNYLRTLEPTEGQGPELLPPRAAQASLDVLIELRDEASFLGLDGLYRLCVDEIALAHRRRMRPRTPRTQSSERSLPSMHGSVNSLHTLSEQMPAQHQHSRSLNGVDQIGEHHQPPPTPESWSGTRARSQPRYNSLRPPPAGWI